MNMNPVENDPLDQVLASAFSLIISFVGCFTVFVVYFIIWSYILK